MAVATTIPSTQIDQNKRKATTTNNVVDDATNQTNNNTTNWATSTPSWNSTLLQNDNNNNAVTNNIINNTNNSISDVVKSATNGNDNNLDATQYNVKDYTSLSKDQKNNAYSQLASAAKQGYDLYQFYNPETTFSGSGTGAVSTPGATGGTLNATAPNVTLDVGGTPVTSTPQTTTPTGQVNSTLDIPETTSAWGEALDVAGKVINVIGSIYAVYSAADTVNKLSDNRTATAVVSNAESSIGAGATIGTGVGVIAACAGYGSECGPWGAVIGAIVGCIAYGVGQMAGVGRQTDLGFTEKTGRHSTDTGWEDLISVSQNQYNNYAGGMNAVNLFNQSQVGNNAASVGDLAEGYHTTKTKGTWGAFKDKTPEWRVNANTGDPILDDYTNLNGLADSWDTYSNWMNEGYTNKLNNSIQNYQDIVEDAIEDQYGLGNAAESVNSADEAQKSEAQRLLANIYNTGDISRSAYTSGLSDIDKQSIANKKNLYDLAEAQNTKWQDMMNEAIAADEDAQIGDQDWMRNYSYYDRHRGGNTSGLLSDMYDRTLNYLNNNLSDDYYNQMLAGNSSYLPYASLTDAYATGDAVTNNDLQNWQDLLLLGNKRKAKQLQYGAE